MSCKNFIFFILFCQFFHHSLFASATKPKNVETTQSKSQSQSQSQLIQVQNIDQSKPNEYVVFCTTCNEYYYHNQKFHTYAKVPSKDKKFLYELGWDADFPINISTIPVGISTESTIIPFPKFTTKYTEKGLMLFLDELNYFNRIFKGMPNIITHATLLPRYEKRSQNTAIIKWQNKYVVTKSNKVILVDDLQEDVEKNDAAFVIPMELVRQKQDLRLYQLTKSNDVFISGTVKIKLPGDCKMGYMILSKKSSNQFQISSLTVLLTEESKTTSKQYSEKNWTPFMYKNEIHFVYSISPLVIVKLPANAVPQNVTYLDQSLRAVYVEKVSSTNCLGFNNHQDIYRSIYKRWIWGILRGGTPAMMVRGQYLSFFHSRVDHNGAIITQSKLYVMGAFTFSAKPPFRITTMSPRPITHEDFVPTLKSAPSKLVVFPMSFYLQETEYDDNAIILEGKKELYPQNTTIVMSIGLNDVDTEFVKINLDALLSSLAPISKCVDGAIE